MDPNITNAAETPQGTPAEAAAAPADPTAEILQAMDQGIEAATPEPVEQQPESQPEGEQPVGGAPEGTTNPEQQQPEGEQGTPAGGKTPEKTEDEKALDEEVKSLGLKDKSESRFREMSAEIKELAPIRDALTKAGIKDIAELPKVFEKAKAADDLIGMVTATGASPDQYGMTLDYLSTVNAAAKGDKAAGERAIAMWMEEGKALHANLGREMPGVYDPLDAHPDLKEAVAGGGLDRALALETARGRRLEQQTAAQREAQAAQSRQQEQEQAVVVQARQGLSAWEQEVSASDAEYVKLRPAVLQKAREISQSFPPQQWVPAMKIAYEGIKAQAAAAAAAARPAASPVRPMGPRPTMVPQFEDPAAALDFGIQHAG